MKTVRFLSAALKMISLITFSASLFFGWLFYVLYLKWVFLFENGRYFDPVEEVVYEDDSLILGVISLFMLLLSLVLWLLASKIKSKRDMKLEKRDE
jgi:hypothetical protein